MSKLQTCVDELKRAAWLRLRDVVRREADVPEATYIFVEDGKQPPRMRWAGGDHVNVGVGWLKKAGLIVDGITEDALRHSFVRVTDSGTIYFSLYGRGQ